MRVLVTGGAGFIGGHLIDALLARGADVRAIDNFSTGRRENIARVADRIEFIEGDLCDPEATARAVAGVDTVFHEAAIPSVARSVNDPVASNRANVGGTVELLQACRVAGVRKLVYAASSSAYGDTEVLPKVETMTPKPLSPYAVSKHTGEQYVTVFGRLFGFETVSLRYFNVFGPRQDPESKYAAVIPRFITAALAGEPAEVHGDGLQSRDFTYVDNVVDANLLAGKVPGVAGEAFNIACGGRFTLLDVLHAIEKGLGRPVARRHEEARAGDVKHTLADVSKARTMLGYEPKVDFDEGMRRTVDWFREQAA